MSFTSSQKLKPVCVFSRIRRMFLSAPARKTTHPVWPALTLSCQCTHFFFSSQNIFNPLTHFQCKSSEMCLRTQSRHQSPNNDLLVSLLTAVSRNTAAASAEIDTLRLYVSFRSVVAKKKKKVVIMKSVVLMNNLIQSPSVHLFSEMDGGNQYENHF